MLHHIHKILSLGILATMLLCGCERQPESIDAEYGYVQFQIVRSSQLETTRAESLEWLSDASKIEIVMQHNGSTITQTLNLYSYDKEQAEWGLLSEKIRLVVGKYDIIGYYVYDALDNKILAGDRQGVFTITHNGLAIKPIGVETVERGKVSFTLYKKFDQTRLQADSDIIFAAIGFFFILVDSCVIPCIICRIISNCCKNAVISSSGIPEPLAILLLRLLLIFLGFCRSSTVILFMQDSIFFICFSP